MEVQISIFVHIWMMSDYDHFDSETSAKLYLAAVLHDIGKLYIPTDILEKPGALEKAEYEAIMKHVWYTHELLKDITGFEDICRWASDHHEKLDGTGYPLGKTASQLDFPSRLMACIDIYQAVCEERPYHPRRDHAQTMPILYRMTGVIFILKTARMGWYTKVENRPCPRPFPLLSAPICATICVISRKDIELMPEARNSAKSSPNHSTIFSIKS